MSDQETPQVPNDEPSQKAKQAERGTRERDRSRRRHHQGQPRRPEASLNMDELRELVELIAEHGFTDFELEREGFRVRLGRDLSPQGSTPPPSIASAAASAAAPQQQPAPPSTTSQAPAASAGQSAATDTMGLESGAPTGAAAAAEDESLYMIPSPIVGTFYRSSSPTAEPFVHIGSHVGPDTVVCIIEAMKLMNEIQAETSGTVAKIYVENGQPVEYGQPLFGIKK
jgi:acetyl-CoA carboxylase biotin carboxyl carrier protein